MSLQERQTSATNSHQQILPLELIFDQMVPVQVLPCPLQRWSLFGDR